MKEPVAVRDRQFKPWRRAKSPRARAMMVSIQTDCLKFEKQNGLRQRARKARDRQIWNEQIDALVSEAVHEYLLFPDRWISISFSKRMLGNQGRYGSKVMSSTLPDVVRLLDNPEIGVLELEMGCIFDWDGKGSRQSRFRAGKQLIHTIDEMEMTVGEFVRKNEGEVIILRRERAHRLDKPISIPYTDTEDTIRYRNEVKIINAWLEQADIEFDEDYPDQNVSTQERYLRRIFNNGSFSEGGRLYGGFWMNLSKKQRKEGLRINGSPIVALDFGQMAARIMYGMAGCQPHFEDAYLLPTLNGQYRSTVKTIFNAMLNSDTPIKRFPPGTRPKDIDGSLKIGHITGGILDHHAPVSHLFYSGHGLKVMFSESQIMLSILNQLMDMNIVALPVHDALLVEEDYLDAARKVMLSTFRKHTGVDARVDIEQVDSDPIYL